MKERPTKTAKQIKTGTILSQKGVERKLDFIWTQQQTNTETLKHTHSDIYTHTNIHKYIWMYAMKW